MTIEITGEALARSDSGRIVTGVDRIAMAVFEALLVKWASQFDPETFALLCSSFRATMLPPVTRGSRGAVAPRRCECCQCCKCKCDDHKEKEEAPDAPPTEMALADEAVHKAENELERAKAEKSDIVATQKSKVEEAGNAYERVNVLEREEENAHRAAEQAASNASEEDAAPDANDVLERAKAEAQRAAAAVRSTRETARAKLLEAHELEEKARAKVEAARANLRSAKAKAAALGAKAAEQQKITDSGDTSKLSHLLYWFDARAAYWASKVPLPAAPPNNLLPTLQSLLDEARVLQAAATRTVGSGSSARGSSRHSTGPSTGYPPPPANADQKRAAQSLDTIVAIAEKQAQ